jgi:hypothetical protein
VDRCGGFDPATRDVDVEQTEVGRIAKGRGHGGRRGFLFGADDEPVLLECEPSPDASWSMPVGDHDAWLRQSTGPSSCILRTYPDRSTEIASPALARSDTDVPGPHVPFPQHGSPSCN